MNTHETYVSLEVAKLLKEAGFDWEVNTCRYNSSPNKISSNGTLASNFNGYAFQHIAISAPTLEVAQKWLREVKGYSIYVTRGGYKIYVLDENDPTGFRKTYELNSILSYEEAQEAGIKKALETILKEREKELFILKCLTK